jgi:hypothetical protein
MQATTTEKKMQVTTVEKKMCTFFLKGECKFGDTCKFSHIINTTKECDICDIDVEPCFFYLEGNCKYGDKCKFNHMTVKELLQSWKMMKSKLNEKKNR